MKVTTRPVRRASGRMPVSQKFANSRFARLIGRKAGGPVRAGQAFVVGERGPELFVPRSSGNIQTIPGGLGRAAAISRAPGKGLAALGRAAKSMSPTSRKTVIGISVSIGAIVAKEIMDRANVSDVWQGGLFVGIAAGLVALSQPLAALGVFVVGCYELGAAGIAWLKTAYPSIANSIPGVGSSTPTPSKAPAPAGS